MRIIFVAAAAAALALSGCGKSDTKTYSDSSGNSVSVSNEGDHMTIAGANGEKFEFGSGTKVTSRLPAYLPLYPGAKVNASYFGSGADGAGGVVTLETHASPAEVIAFYKPKVTAAGMAQTMSAEMGTTTTFAASNDAKKESVSISATRADGSTTVQLTWSGK
jgi:hypothetical protein